MLRYALSKLNLCDKIDFFIFPSYNATVFMFLAYSPMTIEAFVRFTRWTYTVIVLGYLKRWIIALWWLMTHKIKTPYVMGALLRTARLPKVYQHKRKSSTPVTFI